MMKRLRRPLAWFLALAFGCLTASAHTDTMLELKDGKLVIEKNEVMRTEIPGEYLPMEFDAVTHRVRIGKREMKMIPFLAEFFPEDGKCKLRFSSSWYHEGLGIPGTELPPYLAIDIEPEGRQFTYELLLNMKELDVIKLEVVLDLGGGTRKSMPVDLSYWRKDIRESIKVVGKK